MKIKPQDRTLLKKHFSSIFVCIACFVGEKEAENYIARSKDFPDFLNSIIGFLVIKEATGWN